MIKYDYNDCMSILTKGYIVSIKNTLFNFPIKTFQYIDHHPLGILYNAGHFID